MADDNIYIKTYMRNLGIDVLRIVSMLMIVTLHIFTRGGCIMQQICS